MPNPKVCNKIADPAARRRCLEYKGEFAQDLNQPVGPAAPREGIGAPPGGRMGGPRGRMPRRRGGGGFGGSY